MSDIDLSTPVSDSLTAAVDAATVDTPAVNRRTVDYVKLVSLLTKFVVEYSGAMYVKGVEDGRKGD